MVENSLPNLIEETKALKNQQEENLEKFTKKIRVLEVEHNSLLDNKNNVQAFLDEVLSDAKKTLNDSIKEAQEALKVKKRILADCEILESEWNVKKSELDSEIEDFEIEKSNQKEEYKNKKKVIDDRLNEEQKVIESLRAKEKNVDNIKAKLGEEKIELNKRDEDISKSEVAVESMIKENTILIEENSEILSNIEESEKNTIDKKNKNDKILQGIQQENAQLIKNQEDIAFREREIEKDKESNSIREESIKRGDADIKRRLEQADALYEQWKTKLSKE